MDPMELMNTVRSIPDFPKPGIIFRDVTTLFKDPDAYRELMERIAASFDGIKVDAVAGPEARGFVLGSVLAYQLHAGFIPVRKPGKLPYESVSYSYDLEYGSDTVEIHKDAITPGQMSWWWTICWPPAARRWLPASWSSSWAARSWA